MSDSTSPTIRILLVEDHAAVARVTTELLRRLGYDVTSAGSVADALRVAGEGLSADQASSAARAARARGFDVVITDLNLPDGTGTDLMRLLAQRHPLPGIALSAAEPAAAPAESPFFSHLVKPVEIEVLHEAIRRAIEESQAN